MKCKIPEISWHNREPVLSVDLHPVNNDTYKLATAGSDTLILIWQIKSVDVTSSIDIDILSELTRHQKAVNCVRWSPNGQYLASGDDDSNIIIWQLKTDNIPSLDGENNFKETWNVYKIFRGHKEDVYDLCWSPNGNKLFSGSIDNTAILWDIVKGINEHIITDHKSFVQGVAWDPKNQYIATLSSDRICRVFDEQGRRIKSRITRGLLPVDESHNLYNKQVKYFHDDTFRTFFRRLSFSPDGSFLVVPSGSVETDDSKNAMYATYLFTLDSLNKPAAILPTPKQCSIVAKCCPLLFELRPGGAKPIVDLPYRMIIAVATDSDVILYDTQQLSPFAYLQNIHYTRLTDLTWSNDGLLLVASSTDGFITLVSFEPEELGVKYVKEESEEECNLNISGCEILEKIEEVKTEMEIVKPKKPSFLEQWAKQGPKRKAENGDLIKSKKVKTDAEALIESDVKLQRRAVVLVERWVEKNEIIEILDTPDKASPDGKVNVLIPKRMQTNKFEEAVIKPVVPKRITPISVDTKSPKRRITPLKVVDSNDSKFQPKIIDVIDSNKIVEVNNEQETICKIETSDKSEETFPSPITKFITDVKELTEVLSNPKKLISPKNLKTSAMDKPDSAGKRTPKQEISSEEKKKGKSLKSKSNPSPKMSLLQYFKPISVEKSADTLKLNSKSLFKSKKKEEVEPTGIIDLCEDTGDAPEDFHLQVEESMDVDDVGEIVEKENTTSEIKMEVKQPRRIPLITLSSPKIKKKKVDDGQT